MNPITRADGSDKIEIGRTVEEMEINASLRSVKGNNLNGPVSAQELMAIHKQRDTVSDEGLSVTASPKNIEIMEEHMDANNVSPEVDYGVDKVSSLIEKAKARLAQMNKTEGKDILAEQQKMRYPKDEDEGRKYDEKASKDNYFDDYKKGKDYLKELKSNFLLKLKKISSLLQENSGTEVEGKLKVLGANIRRALNKISSVEEDVRMDKVEYKKEKDTGREYDEKSTKDKYVDPDENPINKSLEKMWSLNKTIKTARDESMKLDIPDEKSMGGNDMDKLPTDKKLSLDEKDAPKGKPVKEDAEKMVKELQGVVESLKKADEDFADEISKIEKAIEVLKKDTGKEDKKKDVKKDKDEDKDEDKKGDMGEIEKTPKVKPDLKEMGKGVAKEEAFGKKPMLDKKPTMDKNPMFGKKPAMPPAKKASMNKAADLGLDAYRAEIQNQIGKTNADITVDEVIDQLVQDYPEGIENVDATEVIGKISMIISGGTPNANPTLNSEVNPESMNQQGVEDKGLMATFVRGSTKLGSYWEIKDSEDNIIIKASCKDIYGKKTFENWDWVSSEDYGKLICSKIRNNGPLYVAKAMGTELNMTKEAESLEVNAKSKERTPALTKKITNETDYMAKAYGDKDFAKKMTKDYTKKASLENETDKEENIKIAKLQEELAMSKKENEILAKKLACEEEEKKKIEKEKKEEEKKASGLETDKMLRIRANKSIALASQMINKGLIKESQKEITIDRLMLMDDVSFAMQEEMTRDSQKIADAITENIKGNKLIRKGGLNQGINIVSSNIGNSLKEELENVWKKNKVVPQKN